MQHRRYAQGLADLPEALARHLGSRRLQKAGLAGCDGCTARFHDEDIPLDQALGQGYVPLIMAHVGVVASHDADCSADLA